MLHTSGEHNLQEALSYVVSEKGMVVSGFI